MDIFTLIQRYLARSFGIALQFPGQLLLVSKERLGAPIGAVLKKDFELFGISFSLDVEYSLLKRKLAFDISASKTFDVLGLEITPTIILGKYGVAATLEIGANNYYLSAGIGLDRIPGFSVGFRKGATGFDLSFGGGFADELQFFSGYKTFTIPLGIDFRGRDRNFDRGIPQNAGYNTIDYINNGSSVLVPVNNNLVPFERAARSLTVEIPGGLVAESFGLRSRSVRNNPGNEANRRAVKKIIKSQGGIAGDIVYFNSDSLAIGIKGDGSDLDRAFSEMLGFLRSQNVELFDDVKNVYPYASDSTVGVFRPQTQAQFADRFRWPARMFVNRNQSTDPLLAKIRSVDTLYHETTHFLQNRVGLSRQPGDITQTIGFVDDRLLQLGLKAVQARRYTPREYGVEAEAFATEYNLKSLQSAIVKSQEISGARFTNVPDYYAESFLLNSGDSRLPFLSGFDRAYYYSDVKEYEDFLLITSLPYFRGRDGYTGISFNSSYASDPVLLQRNLADVNAGLLRNGYVDASRLLDRYPDRLAAYTRPVVSPRSPTATASPLSPSKSSVTSVDNAIPLPPSLKSFGLTPSDLYRPPKGMSRSQVADFFSWQVDEENRRKSLGVLSLRSRPLPAEANFGHGSYYSFARNTALPYIMSGGRKVF